MGVTGNFKHVSIDQVEMPLSPIDPKWVVEGAPVARMSLLSRAWEGGAATMLWDCTAGVFHWYYASDETIYFLEGSVVVRDDNGVEHRFGQGDHVMFSAGSHAIWRVESYVRKIAFLRTPAPRPIMLPVLAWKRFTFMARMKTMKHTASVARP